MDTTHTFDNFINGQSNQFVCNVANLIAKRKSTRYNPILFYGSNGVGKTHLLEALQIVLKEQGKKVIFTSISEFEKDYVHSLKKQTIEQFEGIYRDCDVLLIDDIQDLSNKVQIQEEFWKIFNTLYENNKQIVFTSLKEPHALKELMHNVQDKFNWGLAAKIEPLEDVQSSVNYWLIPNNPKQFDAIKAFQDLDEIDWSTVQNYKINIGDIVYIYSSKPIHAITIKAEVIIDNVDKNQLLNNDQEYGRINDIDEPKKYFRLKLLNFTNQTMLSLEKLQQNGLNGNIQGKQTIKPPLLKYILSNEDTDVEEEKQGNSKKFKNS